MLRDIDIKYRYSTGSKDTPIQFFTDTLSNSVNFDLGLGFFSSASINVLATGFARFISNGGKMRMYINQNLSDEDVEAISSMPTEMLEEKLIADVAAMTSLLSKRDKHFFNCLSYLICSHKIDIKIVIPKAGGIAHQKFGILTDANNDKVCFSGSLNFTASALLRNIETIDCYTSWEEGNVGRIEKSEDDFETIFGGKSDAVHTYEPTVLKDFIKTKYPSPNIEQLLEEEAELITKLSSPNASSFTPYELDADNEELHFPYSTGPFEYQTNAYKNWVKNNYHGIFAMATGTGKTITSLNCVLQEYKRTGIYNVLILVPSIDLVNQWIGEVAKFNVPSHKTYVVNGQTDWRKSLTQLSTVIKWGGTQDFVIISTYDSFKNPYFLDLIEAMNENMILIADEAHNVGSPQVREVFENLTIKKRIALSATPKRAYDIEGTMAIESFFNDQPPYCCSFSMEEAIHCNPPRLMEYLYFPRIAYLDEAEMRQYIKLTKVLLQYFNKDEISLKNNKEATELLMKRKRIIHKAQDKYRVFEDIISELVKQNKAEYCFVYAPEGKDFRVDDSQRILETLKDIVNTRYPDITTNTYLGGEKHKKEKLKSFADGHIDMLFAMKCLDEGVDVPRAEVGVFTSSTGNPRQFIQRRGRLLRVHPQKRFARIYDIIVVPNYKLYPDAESYEMERSLVKGELTRVAYFASLASNYHLACESIQDMLDYYNLEVSTLIKELEKQ